MFHETLRYDLTPAMQVDKTKVYNKEDMERILEIYEELGAYIKGSYPPLYDSNERLYGIWFFHLVNRDTTITMKKETEQRDIGLELPVGIKVDVVSSNDLSAIVNDLSAKIPELKIEEP